MSDRHHVLVVDDDDNTRKVLCRQLEMMGYAADEAPDGEAGLDKLRAESFDTALIDNEMPRKTGMELIEDISREGLGAVPIMLTGYANVERAVEAMKLGAFDFLEKPCPPDALEVALERAAMHRRATSQARTMTAVAEQWETVFDAALDLMVIVDTEGRILRCNRAMARRMNRNKEDLVGLPCHEALCDGDHEPDACPFHSLSADANNAATEVCQPMWGGHFEIAFIPLIDRGGRSRGAIFTAHDISERRQAEAAIRESEARMRTILASVQAGIIIIDAETRAIVDVNAAAADMIGLPREAIVRRKSEDFLGKQPARNRSLNGNDQTKTGQEDALITAGGEKLPILETIAPIVLNDRPHLLVSFIDISEIRKAQETRLLLSTAMEQAAETVMITDIDERILYVNPAFEKTTGYAASEAIGQKPSFLSSGQHDEAFYENLEETIRAGRMWSGRFVNRKKDGTIYQEEATISPVRDGSGAIVNFVVVSRDVTKEIHLENELRQAQKLESIGQLAAGIAHEINTPTQFIGDSVRFLQEGFEDLADYLGKADALMNAAEAGNATAEMAADMKETAEEADVEFLLENIPKAIDRSLNGVERVGKIVRAMKDFSHPGGEEKTLTDLNKCIESTVTVARNEWKYVSDLVTDFDASLPLVPCHQGPFNQVVLNMVVNAAHAIGEKLGPNSEEKGEIRVQTRRVDGWAEIRVSDTGTGIPESVRERIFDPFFTTKEVGKGTGQGLSISHQVIVEQHGGAISVETREGEGTTFVIRLPIESGGETEAV